MKNGKFVVLCADDEEYILESLRLVLEGNDYIMSGASSAEEALKKYAQDKPDLILIDMMMETIDAGIELAKRFHGMDAAIPIYMLSSAGDALCLNIEPCQLGLSGVLQKPIDPPVFLKILRERLGS